MNKKYTDSIRQNVVRDYTGVKGNYVAVIILGNRMYSLKSLSMFEIMFHFRKYIKVKKYIDMKKKQCYNVNTVKREKVNEQR